MTTSNASPKESGTTEAATWVAITISVGSLIVAIVALVMSSRTQKKLVQIEEQREADRIQRNKAAELSTKMFSDPDGRRRLVITNRGDSEARNIAVWADDKLLAEYPGIIVLSNIPECIAPGSEAFCLFALAFACRLPQDLRIMWDDDSGTGRQCRTTLTL